MKKTAEKKINTEKSLSRERIQKSTEALIEFTFVSGEAKDVYLVGEFNNWDIRSIPMRKIDGKEWKASLRLKPGRYEYKYFVDGVWIEDAPGMEKVQNTIGTSNFVVYVK